MITKIGICGAAGRMGTAILQACEEQNDIEVHAAIEHKYSSFLGNDVGEQAGIGHIDVKITDDIANIAQHIDVLIDFTVASALAENVVKSHAVRKPMVIGTTGLSNKQKKKIKEVSQDIPIVLAPNMSIGINLCLKLLKITAQAIGADADIEIIEAHHRHKKDAPSGTAIQIGEMIANTLGLNLDECAVYNRQGNISVRKKNDIGFQIIRAGDIIGDHTVIFEIAGERIEISHKASSRKNFAYGAIKAARWLQDKDHGLFSMQDVLSL